jgi:hypothetical protein
MRASSLIYLAPFQLILISGMAQKPAVHQSCALSQMGVGGKVLYLFPQTRLRATCRFRFAASAVGFSAEARVSQ